MPAFSDHTRMQEPSNLVNHHEPEDDEPQTIFRMEDMCILPDGRIVIADHANGLVVFSQRGELLRQLVRPHDTLAFAVKYDPKATRLVVLILDEPGWIMNIYLPTDEFKLEKQIPLPLEPEISRGRNRWLTVSYDGEIFVTAGNCIWQYIKETSDWKLRHQDGRRKIWFSHMVKIPPSNKTDEEKDKYLICVKGDQVHEVKLTEDGLECTNPNVVPVSTAPELGCFTIDRQGSVFIGDWDTGEVIQLGPGPDYDPIRIIGSVGPEEVYHLSAGLSNRMVVGCKSSLAIKAIPY